MAKSINLFIKVCIFVICSYSISVKDEIIRVGGVLNIPINQYLIQSVKSSHGRYIADLEAKRVLQEKEKEKAKYNNMFENETGMEDVDEKIK